MARERCLQKSFKDSLEDIKERMKEKRNQKWAKLGKTSQVLSAKCKIADNSSMRLKSLQANNQGLALALEEEKRKVREAQDIILHMKKEYQHLKFQMFDIQRKLVSQQGKECAETKFIALKKIILKAVQHLLEATNLLNTEHKDQNQYDSVHEDCNAIYLRTQYSLVENTSANIAQTNIGWENNSHEKRNISSDGEDGQADNSLPKSVSTRRRCFKTQNKLNISDSNHSEIPEQIDKCCQEDHFSPEPGLENEELCIDQDMSLHIVQENKCNVNMNHSLEQSDMQIESHATAVDPNQKDFNSDGDSQTQNKRHLKRKLETQKSSSRIQSKKRRSRRKQSCSKEMADKPTGSHDAYDFIFEESVHMTPFRQNKENDNSTNDKEREETIGTPSSDSFTSQENSDDSLYVPYAEKSKRQKSSNRNDVSPVHTRLRLKKSLEIHSRGSFTSGENSDDNLYVPYTEKSKCQSSSNKNDVSPVHTRQRLKKSTVLSEQCTGNSEGENKNAKKSEILMNEPSETLQTPRLHLGDITNRSLPSSTGTISHPPVNREAKDTFHLSRRCTVSVSYKEPSLSGKLRRGDPFTDTGFLHSPIFKDKKSKKRKSVKKKLLSRYNEAFIRCSESL